VEPHRPVPLCTTTTVDRLLSRPYKKCQHGRELNEAIDFTYFSEPRRDFTFDLNDRTYTLDWSRMIQRNIRTGTERPIRCALPDQENGFVDDDWCVRTLAERPWP
jgi:hypothetical protein